MLWTIEVSALEIERRKRKLGGAAVVVADAVGNKNAMHGKYEVVGRLRRAIDCESVVGAVPVRTVLLGL